MTRSFTSLALTMFAASATNLVVNVSAQTPVQFPFVSSSASPPSNQSFAFAASIPGSVSSSNQTVVSLGGTFAAAPGGPFTPSVLANGSAPTGFAASTPGTYYTKSGVFVSFNGYAVPAQNSTIKLNFYKNFVNQPYQTLTVWSNTPSNFISLNPTTKNYKLLRGKLWNSVYSPSNSF